MSVHTRSNSSFLPLLRSPRGLTHVANKLTIHLYKTVLSFQRKTSGVPFQGWAQRARNIIKEQSVEVYSYRRMISTEGTLPLDCVYKVISWGEKPDRCRTEWKLWVTEGSFHFFLLQSHGVPLLLSWWTLKVQYFYCPIVQSKVQRSDGLINTRQFYYFTLFCNKFFLNLSV